jgi:hypothetical protein
MGEGAAEATGVITGAAGATAVTGVTEAAAASGVTKAGAASRTTGGNNGIRDIRGNRSNRGNISKDTLSAYNFCWANLVALFSTDSNSALNCAFYEWHNFHVALWTLLVIIFLTIRNENVLYEMYYSFVELLL